MALRTVIECDRCGDTVTAGVVCDVDRVVYVDRGQSVNINKFGDPTGYDFCDTCAEAVRQFITAGVR